ncbi:PAS domain-containing sensor histidine kinase [Actinomadura decatromicini]|uniref:sensor histidine kinase n=1 Tax=Actinomadura decatromicini TaxID=2604572 RepID=UPI001653202F|nr:PAS domain-containing sensor histidine kinase [Actinomadura decatromicini]
MAEVDFSAVFEASPVAVAVLSPVWEYVAVNGAYERLTGWSRGELLGRNVFEVFPGGRSDRAEQLRASLERVVAVAEVDTMPLQRYDTEEPGLPGVFHERYWSIVNAPVLGPDGAVMLVINRVEEVTGFIQRLREIDAASGGEPLPEELVAGTRAIEAELFVRARELQEVNRRLRGARERERQAAVAARRALRRQQQAVADTSHDLRGPLAGLQTRLESALADPDADSRQILHAALHDAERIGDIVSDLLELARLEANTPLRTQRVDLAHLARTETARRAEGHRLPDVSVTVDAEDAVEVDASPVRLTRLLNNLLDNAERHARSRVHITVTREDGHAVVDVTDDGPGIPADERENVFDRFYRGADARRSDPGGTGLGLPIARQIALAHHGTLHIADHSPGTRFTLRLPLHRPDHNNSNH